MVDLEVIEQLINSMDSSLKELELQINSGKKEEAYKIKAFIFDLHQKIEKAIRSG